MTNYNIMYLPGDLTITPAAGPLVFTADNKTMTYGAGSLPALTYHVSGFVNGDTLASLATQPVVV